MIQHKDKYIIAIICCIIAHLSFTIMSAFAKYLSTDYHVAEIVFYRNIIIFVPMLLFLLIPKNRHFFHTNKPKLILLRALIGGVSLMVTFAALVHLPMAYSTVLFFTSALITPVLALIFLKEYIGLHRWSAIIIGFIGVLIIAQPGGAISVTGVILALIAATLHAIMFTVVRGLKTESPLTITFYFVFIGWLFPALFLPWVGQGIMEEHIPAIMMVALAGISGQIFLVYSLKYAPASFITPFGYSSLLWTSLIDIYIWQYDLAMIPLLTGSLIILGAQIYILFREHKQKEKTHE